MSAESDRPPNGNDLISRSQLRANVLILKQHPGGISREATVDTILHLINAAAGTDVRGDPLPDLNGYDRALMFLLADMLPEKMGGQIHQGHIDRLRSIGERMLVLEEQHARP